MISKAKEYAEKIVNDAPWGGCPRYVESNVEIIEYEFAPSMAGLIADVVWGDPLVVLGGGEVKGYWTVMANRVFDDDPKTKDVRAEWTVIIEYHMADEFTDPLDLFDSTPDIETDMPGCKPYTITASWLYVQSGAYTPKGHEK